MGDFSPYLVKNLLMFRQHTMGFRHDGGEIEKVVLGYHLVIRLKHPSKGGNIGIIVLDKLVRGDKLLGQLVDVAADGLGYRPLASLWEQVIKSVKGLELVKVLENGILDLFGNLRNAQLSKISVFR